MRSKGVDSHFLKRSKHLQPLPSRVVSGEDKLTGGIWGIMNLNTKMELFHSVESPGKAKQMLGCL